MKLVSYNDYSVTIKEGLFKKKRVLSYREYFDLVFPMFDSAQELGYELNKERYRSFMSNHAACVSCYRDLIKQQFNPVSVVLCSHDGNDEVIRTTKRVAFSSVEMFRSITNIGDVVELGDIRFVRVSNIVWKVEGEGKDNYMNDFDLVMRIVFHGGYR